MEAASSAGGSSGSSGPTAVRLSSTGSSMERSISLTYGGVGEGMKRRKSVMRLYYLNYWTGEMTEQTPQKPATTGLLFETEVIVPIAGNGATKGVDHPLSDVPTREPKADTARPFSLRKADSQNLE